MRLNDGQKIIWKDYTILKNTTSRISQRFGEGGGRVNIFNSEILYMLSQIEFRGPYSCVSMQ